MENNDIAHIKLRDGHATTLDTRDYDKLSDNDWKLMIVSNKKYARYFDYNKKTKKITCILMHRVIMCAKKGETIDHINGDGLDNRRVNLRKCTQRQNTQNRPGDRNSSCKWKGVSLHKATGSYRGHISIEGKYVSLGYSDDFEMLAMQYNLSSKEYHGDFSYQNVSKYNLEGL